MRFTTAWANVSIQNVTLKTVAISLSVCVLILSVIAVKLALKDPIVIDRACYSKTLQISNGKHTKDEIDSFLKEALSMRFDSSVTVKPGFLLPPEESVRIKEQTELSQRQMIQRVIFNSSVVKDSVVIVDADRLISVGKVRSAFPIKIQATLLDTTRTESNPYGLVLGTLSPVSEKDSK